MAVIHLKQILNVLYILGIFVNRRAQGVNIQFYKYENWTGLVLESNSSDNCVKFSYTKVSEVTSIKTDTCFIAYSSPYCKPAVSKKFMPGVIHGSHVSALERFHYFGSFHTCNENEGGSQLNLDITERPFFMNFNPVILESYKNLCSCVNVPQFVQNMSYWSIDNHHNELLAYFEADCSAKQWNAKFIAAGHNWDTRAMYIHNKTDTFTDKVFKIMSFGPNPNSTYFQASCNSSQTTTEPPKTYEGTTENIVDFNADFNKRFQVLTNQIVQMQRTHEEDFKKLEQLEQQVGNLSALVESDLHQVKARIKPQTVTS